MEINKAIQQAASIADFDPPLNRLPDVQASASGLLLELLRDPREMPISGGMRSKIERLNNRVVIGEHITTVEFVTLMRELHNDIVSDLGSMWFVSIPEDRREYAQQKSPLFGAEIQQIFPETTLDIASAGRCLAFDEYTAAVFHLMRVLERGLHAFARHLDISMVESVDLENWKNIIDRIDKQIRSMEQLPKSADKVAMLQGYSQVATNLWYFKEAWRNHVSHSRATYSEKDALSIFMHVREFMQKLVSVTN